MEISIVVPINNEGPSIRDLYSELTIVLSEMGRDYEILAVDDGSTDESLENLVQLRQQDEHLKIISFTRQYGLTAALRAGIDYAGGDIIIAIDGDLEQDPRDIPKLVEKLEEGFDLVAGWRQNRWRNSLREKIFRRIPSATANWLLRLLTGVPVRDNGCTFKAYRAEFIKELKLYGEMHRFIPILASLAGARMAEVKVGCRARKYGKSHYSLFRTTQVLLDLVVLKFLQDYSTRPMQIFGGIGLLLGSAGTVFISYLVFVRLVMREPIADRPALILSVMLVLLGVQFVVMGLLGELIVRTYYESQGKPTYIIREKRL